MKRALTLLGVGVAALTAQGALATALPPPWCPDLALLVLIGIGLRWSGVAAGLALAAMLGYATDLLSGSLLGQHALLDLFAFLGTMIAARQLNLRGAWPLACFAAGLCFVYGLSMLAITGFFVGGAELRLGWLGAQALHAAVTAACAPAVSSLVGRAVAWADDEPGHRSLGLDAIRRSA
jgi:cell shape-determining protein MreD